MTLVTVNRYREVVDDDTTPDSDVENALAEAQEIAEAITGRKFERGTYTENLRRDTQGRMWPSATPLVSVSSPSGATVRGGAILGVGGWWGNDYTIVGWPGPPTETSVTYVGGYEPEDAPVRLTRAICLLAQAVLLERSETATASETVLTGATSVRVGDVAVSGPNLELSSSGSSATGVPDAVAAGLLPYKRRRLVA